ncbi:SusC/RagA family TonB-linked outer membrane protein [Sphingobacterium sp. DK4209]|uniref:SusC/RagA family TonB-linked outer membrane protein n=2 Tax=Sphingobacterium zhuxiongii TaxID=2662364 RepID=A0A5Q0QCL1_9SPHI|nr:SusC/RagA family TonB-linked outer membrane protein [Sphingobacterium sp. DK4209]QGA24950.1 SusC/RagA family TonB-linked outer membrane protein [Sphingobacterium sp. dk4302]
MHMEKISSQEPLSRILRVMFISAGLLLGSENISAYSDSSNDAHLSSFKVNVLKLNANNHSDHRWQKSLSGTVRSTDGGPIQGVSVKIKGSNTGTSTNELGQYQLESTGNSNTLVFSAVGYLSQEITISSSGVTDAVLESDVTSIGDVVVIGYGTQKKRNVTSSISTVSAKTIKDYPVLQAGQAIQGKVPGAQIIQNSGSPGASLMVRIRGAGTVNNASPLYVVDGNIGVDPRDLDPNHIESIEVLKSASAAAIYGAQGANGVILITTKSGKEGVNASVSYYSGIQSIHNKLDVANGQEYATLYNEALVNGGKSPIFSDVQSLGVGTDWQDAIFRTAKINSGELSLSGGNSNGKFYLSGSYFNQEGIVMKSDYERITFRINSEYNLSPAVKIGENISLSRGKSNVIPEFGDRNPIPNAWAMDPNTPVKNPNGSWGFPQFSDTKNPVAELELYNNTIKRPVLNGSAFIDVKLLPSLVFRSQYNLNFGISNGYVFVPTYDIFPLQRNLVSSISRTNTQFTNWDWQNTLTYNTNFADHHFDALAGFTVLRNQEENITARGEGLPENANFDENLRYLDLARSGNLATGGAGDYSMVSFLGRVNYDYKGTYLFTGNMRVDGSSRFGKNNRYGIFPSFSVGWRLSDEEFLKDVGFINDLKLRAGWGMLGNQNSLPNYAFANSVAQNIVYPMGDRVTQGHAPTSLGNENLKWESTKETEVGIDFTGFNNRINIAAGYYDKRTMDMLLRVPVADYLGIQTAPFVNGGDVRNHGFEFMIGYNNGNSEGIRYEVSFNLARNINEVTKLSNQQAALFSGSYSRTAVGEPIASFYGYVMDGIFQTIDEVKAHATQAPSTAPGDIRYKDLNNDGIINQSDRTTIGNPWPDFNYGINGRVSWNNFDMSLAFNGVWGNELIAHWKYFTHGSNFYNYDTEMFNAWKGAGTTNEYPRLNVNDPNNNMRPSSYYVEDGSYLRLQNAQLGYTFPTAFSGHVKNLRVYASGQNLLTFTKYRGYDPEIGAPSTPLSLGVDNGFYPQPRIVTLGLGFGF